MGMGFGVGTGTRGEACKFRFSMTVSFSMLTSYVQNFLKLPFLQLQCSVHEIPLVFLYIYREKERKKNINQASSSLLQETNYDTTSNFYPYPEFQ